ncbi:MAG: LysR family transcriptional regulator [Alphaproteobacteria bacterium]|nr:LysR family transcriptional regulator [Alphaproteobacteria bacterium]
MSRNSRLPLKAMMYFDAVARHRSLTRAGEELDVSSSAVSQQVKALEGTLGTALFRRVKHGLVLTEDGERLFKATSEALDLLYSSERQISRRSQHRPLSVRVAPSFGALWLTRRLPAFIRAHPDMDIRIDATTELTDFDKEMVDLDIRYGRSSGGDLTSEMLAEDLVVPLCDQETYRKFAFRDPAEILGSVRLISSMKSAVSWDRWLVANNIQIDTLAEGLQFDRSSMSLYMASQGLGVALESTTLAHNYLAEGGLRPLFPALKPVANASYWLTCPNRHLSRRSVQIFRDWLLDEAGKDRQALDELHAKLLGSNRPAF